MERFVRMAGVVFIIAGAVNVGACYAWHWDSTPPWLLLIGGAIVYLIGEAAQN